MDPEEPESEPAPAGRKKRAAARMRVYCLCIRCMTLEYLAGLPIRLAPGRRRCPREGASAGLSSEGIYRHRSCTFAAKTCAPMDPNGRRKAYAPVLPLATAHKAALASMSRSSLQLNRRVLRNAQRTATCTPRSSRSPECSRICARLLMTSRKPPASTGNLTGHLTRGRSDSSQECVVRSSRT